MKRTAIGLLLALALILGFCSTASASPVLPAEAGEFYIAGDYFTGPNSFGLGVGYAVSEQISLGLEYYFSGYIDFNAQALFGKFLLQADFYIQPSVFAMFYGYYAFDLGPAALGLGAFVSTSGNYGFAAAANVALGEDFDLYGRLEASIISGYYILAGLSYAL